MAEFEILGKPSAAKKTLPSFAKMWESFPTGEASAVKASLGGSINADWITNINAIRVSRALSLAGHTIPANFVLSNGKKWMTVAGGDGRLYAARTLELRQYLNKTFGEPTVKHVYSGDGGAIPPGINGRKGIILFDIKLWTDAAGHLDLWDGSKAIQNAYFDKAKEVSLWVAPD